MTTRRNFFKQALLMGGGSLVAGPVLTKTFAVKNDQKGTNKIKENPVIASDWWAIAGNPDLGKYTSKDQQPVDFAVWQADDGTWQLWSCIRGTKAGKHTRLFYRWQAKSLTDKYWTPMGIAMMADTSVGETSGGLQAPYVFKTGDTYYMVYGDWNSICLAKSKDGKHFTRVLNEDGESALFSGPYNNTRDPMVIKVNGLYYCYYMGHTNKDGTIMFNGQKVKMKYKSAIFCRTSSDLKNWSKSVMVSAGGDPANEASWWGGDAECPHVVKKMATTIYSETRFMERTT